MLNLPEEFPEVHQEFMKGNFAAQLLENRTFSRSETDKVIEMTLNKETKSSGGTTGFSTNKNAVKRFQLNTTYRAAMRACFHEHLNYRPQQHLYPDLMHSRIKRYNTDVNNLSFTLTTTFINPFSPELVLSTSSGITTPDNINQDIIVPQEKGKEVMNKFIEERLWHYSSKSFSIRSRN